MLKCPYEENRAPDRLGPQGETIEATCRCRVLAVAAGFIRSVGPGICRPCIQADAWNVSGAPRLKATVAPRTPTAEVADTIVRGSEQFRALHVAGLRTRFIAGDCPRYQGKNPIDLAATLQKYIGFSTQNEQRELLKTAYDYGIRVLPENGGWPADTLLTKLDTLSQTYLDTPIEAIL